MFVKSGDGVGVERGESVNLPWGRCAQMLDNKKKKKPLNANKKNKKGKKLFYQPMI